MIFKPQLVIDENTIVFRKHDSSASNDSNAGLWEKKKFKYGKPETRKGGRGRGGGNQGACPPDSPHRFTPLPAHHSFPGSPHRILIRIGGDGPTGIEFDN
jgi:hypothetical protein